MTSDNQDPQLFSAPSAPTGVGALLRETREKLGRDLPYVAQTLRIRQPFLEAIEESRFRDLPGSTYAIGFVRGYAEYLGLDGQEIVRRFKQEHGDLTRGNHLVFPSAVSEGGIPTGALLALAVGALVVLYFGWHWYQGHEQTPVETSDGALPDRLSSLMHQPVGNGTEIVPVTSGDASKVNENTSVPLTATTPPTATAPAASTADTAAPASDGPTMAASPASNGPASNGPAPTPAVGTTAAVSAPAVAAASPPPASPPSAATPASEPSASSPATPPDGQPPSAAPSHHAMGRIVLQADDKCWIKILDANGKVVSSRLLQKGDSFSPPSRPGLRMTVGNAGVLKLIVDGTELPPLGGIGMVRHDVSLDPDRLLGKSTDSAEPNANATGDNTAPPADGAAGDMPTPEKPSQP